MDNIKYMRPLTAEISLRNLRHNYEFLKCKHGKKLLAIIKANGYGHGAVACAHALNDIADGFGVAILEEAIELRKAGIVKPIVILEGALGPTEYEQIDCCSLWPVIHHRKQLQEFQQYKWKNRTKVWLKMDSGMHRVGFSPSEYESIYSELKQNSFVEEIIKMTHLSCADDMDCREFTFQQINTFNEATKNCLGASSISNSAAILCYPESHREWGRAGIALYGASPFDSNISGLKPVMTLKSKIIAERILRKGEGLGYGRTFTADHDMRVGVVACGYGDGYPRLPSNDNPVFVEGRLSRVVGRVSMDMITIELNDNKQTIGSEVELWGSHVSVNEIAQRSLTIPYEIFCHIKRAEYKYV